MKKQILTLAMCLALTSTAALANGTTAVAKKTPAKAPQKVVKTIPVAQVKPTAEVMTPEQQAKKRFEEKMKTEREHFYSTLSLTEEQKAKAEAMDKKHREEARPLFEKMKAEKTKLRELKAKKACPCEIAKQKHEVKVARKALKSHFEASRKEFETLLTPAQMTKLKEMETQRKAERAKCHCGCKCHKHFKPHGHHGPCALPPAPPETTKPGAPAAIPAPAPTGDPTKHPVCGKA